jgi:competence protein ComEA
MLFKLWRIKMKKILLALVTFLSFSISAMAGVNINTATQAELESLKGIGPVKAQAIIDYRKKNGNFKSVDELEKVNGVGPATLQNVRNDIAVNGATTVVAKPATTKTSPAKDAKPMKEMTKVAPATPTTAVKVDDKEAAKKAKADEKAAKKAAVDEKKAAKKAEADKKAVDVKAK